MQLSLDYDVVVCGGTLGIFIATALQVCAPMPTIHQLQSTTIFSIAVAVTAMSILSQKGDHPFNTFAAQEDVGHSILHPVICQRE